MGVKERLREYIKTLNISEREFCRQIGVSSSYVNNIRQSIQPDKMKAIGEKFPELNPMWLLTGDGTMRNGDNTNRWKSGYRHRANLKRLSMKLPGR